MLKIAILFLTLSTYARADWQCYPGRGGEECTEVDPPWFDFQCQLRVTSSAMDGFSVGETIAFKLGATNSELYAELGSHEFHGPLGSKAERTKEYAEISDPNGDVRFEFGAGHFHLHVVELWPDYHTGDMDAYCGSVLPFVTTH